MGRDGGVRRLQPGMWGRRWVVVAVVAGIAYAVGASFTHPFTHASEGVTALALVGAAVGLAWRMRANGGRVGTPATWPSRWGHRWVAWAALAAAAGAWELSCYLSAPRVAHPTFSVLLDDLDATRPGKAVAFTVWLAVGWFLVAR